MKIGQMDSIIIKSIDIRGMNPGITRAAEIAITLVVGNDDNDIGRIGINNHTFDYYE